MFSTYFTLSRRQGKRMNLQQILQCLDDRRVLNSLGKMIKVEDTEMWQLENKYGDDTEMDCYVSRYTCNYTLLNDEGLKETRLCDPFMKSRSPRLQFIAGLDVSYMRSQRYGCAALVVCRLPRLEVVYEDIQMVQRDVLNDERFHQLQEVPAYVEAIKRLEIMSPHLKPQVLLIDGHGITSHELPGPACLVGTLTDIPAIGITKRLRRSSNERLVEILVRDDGSFTFSEPFKTGIVASVVVKTRKVGKPLVVTIGHRCTVLTAINVVVRCLKFRIPEPIRQADLRSRMFLREKFPHLV